MKASDIKCAVVMHYIRGEANYTAAQYVLTSERISFLEQFFRNPTVVLRVHVEARGDVHILPFMADKKNAIADIVIFRENVMDPLIMDHIPKRADHPDSPTVGMIPDYILEHDMNWFVRLLDVLSPTPNPLKNREPEQDPQAAIYNQLNSMFAQSAASRTMHQAAKNAMHAAMSPSNPAAQITSSVPMPGGFVQMPTKSADTLDEMIDKKLEESAVKVMARKLGLI